MNSSSRNGYTKIGDQKAYDEDVASTDDHHGAADQSLSHEVVPDAIPSLEFKCQNTPHWAHSIQVITDPPSPGGQPSASPPASHRFPPRDSLVDAIPNWHNPIPPITPISSQQFLAVVEEVRRAIQDGIQPLRITQGSSGSYFCRNRDGDIIGVFKPKNEEPYGKLNPKWVKWLHKNLFPCCFGRSCLIPNLGYISEAGASYVDRRLALGVVPRTEVVSLSSPAFFYGPLDRRAYEKKKKPLPPKLGSFQLFLRGYKDASLFFRDGYDQVLRATLSTQSSLSLLTSDAISINRSSTTTNVPCHSQSIVEGAISESSPILEPATAARQSAQYDSFRCTTLQRAHDPSQWAEAIQREFQNGFERLVVLDYLIRNTDRGLDNWMIKYNPGPAADADPVQDKNMTSGPNTASTQQQQPSNNNDNSSPSTSNIDAATKETPTPFPKSPDTPKTPSIYTSPPLIPALQISGRARTTSAPPPPQTTSIAAPPIAPVSALPYFQLPDAHLQQPSIRVAAIDNGLAFPFKHPDRIRSYPYAWAALPCARVPFSADTRALVLPLLTSQEWWKETFDGLEKLARIDPDFKEDMWSRQKAVMRGQGYNLVEVLRRSELNSPDTGSPAALVRRPVVAVFEEVVQEVDYVPDSLDAGAAGNPRSATGHGRRRLRRMRQRFETLRSQPCFSWC
ncbi:hypothetical protein SeMB42_g06929 [Synchytrium endobioticum]|uniref:Phosphatidylinositol 4-kinase n=1 Tax=Synchytrium endobioticum TaxID=286115 RepID=A0A507CDB7_9FUNG|nr:hypothetical protein SeMB42_g06929 [Synchytrium endobioticum]